MFSVLCSRVCVPINYIYFVTCMPDICLFYTNILPSVLKVLMTAYTWGILQLTLIGCMSQASFSKCLKCTPLPPYYCAWWQWQPVYAKRSRVVQTHDSIIGRISKYLNVVSAQTLGRYSSLWSCPLGIRMTPNEPWLLQVQCLQQWTESISKRMSKNASDCGQRAIAPHSRTDKSGSGMCPESPTWTTCSQMPMLSTRTCPSGTWAK